ncbi:MAG: protease inhibitor I42 family protein [Hyphomicrobiaceae bacterium]|nr:protease inhibitor I42 family protein [Hyphomicrobiaceae bacterium]
MHSALALALFSSAAVASEPREIEKSYNARVGEQLFLKLPGDPEKGYKWRFNPGASAGAHLVNVDPLGWLLAKKGVSIFFQELSVLNVAVKAKAAGRADLAFDYYRDVGRRRFTKTRYFRIDIRP